MRYTAHNLNLVMEGALDEIFDVLAADALERRSLRSLEDRFRMTVLELLEATTGYFTKHGVPSARLTSELMLADALEQVAHAGLPHGLRPAWSRTRCATSCAHW